MGDGDRITAAIFIIVVGFLLTMLFTSYEYIEETTSYEYYDIYYCTAPFGMVWLETDASASGAFIYIVGIYNYRTETQLVEIYNVKYLQNGGLKTKVFDAYEISVVPDGRFILEVKITNTTRHSGCLAFHGVSSKTTYSDWKIHIPELPRLNQTITKEWMFVK